jgi:ELWxxDGT repeat protein
MLGAIGSTRFFSAYSNTQGYELYKAVSSGTNSIPTVSLVRDINLTPRQQSQTEAITFNNGGSTYTVFGASDSQYGAEPRVSVNGAAPTVPLKDILAGGFGSDPRGFTVGGTGSSQFGYFTADDGKGRQLWRTNGTAAGTTKVALPTSGLGTGFVADSQVVVTPAGTPYFVGYSSAGTHILSVSGGTATLADNRPVGSSVTELTAIPGGALFTGIQDAANPNDYEPRWINGNSASVQLSDVNPGPNGSFPYEYVNFGGLNYFAADNGTGYEPFKLTGYTATLVRDLNSSGGSNLTGMNAMGLFAAYTDTSDYCVSDDCSGSNRQTSTLSAPKLNWWKVHPTPTIGAIQPQASYQSNSGVAGSYMDYTQSVTFNNAQGQVMIYPNAAESYFMEDGPFNAGTPNTPCYGYDVGGGGCLYTAVEGQVNVTGRPIRTIFGDVNKHTLSTPANTYNRTYRLTPVWPAGNLFDSNGSTSIKTNLLSARLFEITKNGSNPVPNCPLVPPYGTCYSGDTINSTFTVKPDPAFTGFEEVRLGAIDKSSTSQSLIIAGFKTGTGWVVQRMNVNDLFTPVLDAGGLPTYRPKTTIGTFDVAKDAFSLKTASDRKSVTLSYPSGSSQVIQILD